VKRGENVSRKYAKKIISWHIPSSLIELPVCEENTILKKTKVTNKKNSELSIYYFAKQSLSYAVGKLKP
jgi:hypothetical protein